MNNKRNKFILSYSFLEWLHVETRVLLCSVMYKNTAKNSPFPWRIYCLCVSLYARIKKGQRQEVCKNMCIYIPGSTETSDYNKLKSNHSRGFISIIPHIKPICLLLDQILKLLGSTVQKILRLRLWNIITLLISAGRYQQLRITLVMRQVKIYTLDWRQSFYS